MKTQKKSKHGTRLSQPFHLLCKPIGSQCNLRCAHCFYLKKSSLYPNENVWRMNDKTLDKFIRSYLATQQKNAEVQFAWQGGEPTLIGLDFYKKAVQLQKKYAADGVTVTNALQTNGTLLDDEWGDFLAENNFLVGISVDGPKFLHDRYRVRADGQGSFDDVMKGLDVLRRHHVEYNTLTCVQADNAAQGKEIYAFLRDECGSSFMQFIPIVEWLPDGRFSDRSCSGNQLGQFMNAVFDAWLAHDVGTVYVQHVEMLISVLMGYPASMCTHSPVCGRALVVEHNGDVYACDHFVSKEHLRGNLCHEDLGVLIEKPEQKEFGCMKSDKLSAKCHDCKFLRFCYGGCPSDRDPDGLNVNCAGYMAFYDHALPILQWMAQALRMGRPASDWMHLASGQIGR